MPETEEKWTPPAKCPECGTRLDGEKQSREHAKSHWGLGGESRRPDDLKGLARERWRILTGGK